MTKHLIDEKAPMGRTWAHTRKSLVPRACEFCAGEYQPTSRSQLWCEACAPNAFYMKMIRAFGINRAGFDKVLAAQDNKCAICSLPFSPEHMPGEVHKNPFPCVDHDHVTGRFRGLLCLRCNTRLGGRGDETTWLLAALQYIRDTTRGVVLVPYDDPCAQDILYEYAQRRRAGSHGSEADAEYADEIESALRAAGFVPPAEAAPPPSGFVGFSPGIVDEKVQIA
jgi:hypothetical protein